MNGKNLGEGLTEREKERVRAWMRRKLDNYFSGGSALPDTGMSEKVRTISDKELEALFKNCYKVKSENFYF